MKIINLTPHKITIRTGESAGFTKVCNFEPAKTPARVHIAEEGNGRVFPGNSTENISVSKTFVTGIENLPEPQEDTIYIVSRQVAEAAKDRDDLYITHGAIRGNDGQIIGVSGLAQIEHNPKMWIVTDLGIYYYNEYYNDSSQGTEITRFATKKEAQKFQDSMPDD